ncbi:MAG TPA: hypothetical protein H9810_06370 [Candidatus Gemmiger excrementavium]|uniref:Uncharacterized protein n=1 Tax=Candidatus Gemmiger excrementavium TaxID=2838608 RepID=A0A9D2JF91_9FIRM|nr:hypothetical protein [Candidatus Gemmiger excrementavium]
MTEESKVPRLDRPLRADEVVVQVLDVTKDWARVRLWPKVDAVRSILEEYDSVCAISYAVRHYSCGRALYCGVGLASNTADELVYRDACAISTYHVTGDPAQDECDSSFLAAASLWGVALPVLRMPFMRLSAEQVHIIPDALPGSDRIKGYVMDDVLTCTELGYENGDLTLVQFTKPNGKKLLWQKS